MKDTTRRYNDEFGNSVALTRLSDGDFNIRIRTQGEKMEDFLITKQDFEKMIRLDEQAKKMFALEKEGVENE